MKTLLHTCSLGTVSYRLLGAGKRKILFFHGFPGSSQQVRLFERFQNEFDLQVVCFDRPGYNQTQITLSDDMMLTTLQVAKELTASLGWSQFEVFGVSGGAPYALSYAGLNPNQVIKTRIVCGLGALDIKEVSKYFSKLAKISLKVVPKIPGVILKKVFAPPKKIEATKNSSEILNYFLPLSKQDVQIRTMPGVEEDLGLALAEALSQNALGPQIDAEVYVSGWSKYLSSIQSPVCFWHGTDDKVIHPKISEKMSAAVADSKFFLVPNHGHLSLPIADFKIVLEEP